MNMQKWLDEIKTAKVKKPMPILSFPCVSLMGISVKDLTANSSLQAKGMKMVAGDDGAAIKRCKMLDTHRGIQIELFCQF